MNNSWEVRQMVVSDVPDNKQNGNGNKTAHDRAWMLLDATPLACRLMKRVGDKDYELFECNEESVKLFKFKDKQEFMDRYFEIFPELQPDGSNSLIEGHKLIEKAFIEGRCVSQFMFRTSDGEPVPAEVTLVRLEYEDDFIIAGYTRDLREHERMMETIEHRNTQLNQQAVQIRDAHKRAQLLLDTAPLAIHLWDRNMNLFDCNEETVRLFKAKDKQDYLNRFRDLSPEYQPYGALSVETAKKQIKKTFDEGKMVFEWMHRDTEGNPIPSEITLVRVAFEDDYAVAGYVRDLREQKAMHYEIYRKSRLLDSVNRAANILLQSEIEEFEINLQLCMGMIGKAANADRMSIWKNSVINGKLHCSLIDEWISDERLRTSSDISTDVPYESNIPTFEKILTKGECINSLTRDLSPIEQARMEMHDIKSVFVAPVFVHDEFWGFVGCDDCNDEHVFPEEVATTLKSGSLLIANALLRNEMTLNLQSIAAELKTALMDTRKANDAKSDFLANMSHEMRTPLNAIIGLTWLSLENDNLDKETLSNLEKTHNAGTTLLGLVNDILDISKIESGKLELVPVEYNVASLINDTVTQNLLRIGEKPIELKLDVDKNLYENLIGDELRLKQIMNNLLSNAIKYSSEGDVEFTVYCERDGDVVWLIFKVKDSGQGIKPEDICKLFDNYAQLDTKANRKIEGTGLGLPITKMLCDLMDGTIDVESEYGKGSTFKVRLKQKFVSDAVIGLEVVSSLNRFHYSDGRRNKNMRLSRISLPYASVLIVDDNPTNLDVARGLMKPYGMHIDCVDSGQKAIDAIAGEADKYDAIFMDQMMPGMDGIEATRRIRELSTSYARYIPIIALTANAVVGNEEMFLSKGFQAFLSKPIDIARLDAVLRQWVRDHEKDKLLADVETQEESYKGDPDSGINEGLSLLAGKEVAGLNIENGVRRFRGDEEVYINILHSYALNTCSLVDSIDPVPDNKLKSYEITVHSIKGSSYGVCADTVGRLAGDLERAAKECELDYIKKHNGPFVAVARKLIADINEMLDSLNLDSLKPLKDKPDVASLLNLISACVAYDMDEVDVAMEEITHYQYENENDLVAWLKENVNMMNFDEIVERLTSIMESKDGSGKESNTVVL